jgi:parvulin-like peptidyl-prolyl isomerase
VAPARVTFQQVALDDAGAAEGVRTALEAGTDPEGLVGLGLLPSGMTAAGETAVDGAFGPGFFERIAGLSPGGWRGAVASAYGLHLVEVLGFEPETVQPFEAVRTRVAQDWRQATADAVRQAQYEALRARYEVVLPGDAE